MAAHRATCPVCGGTRALTRPLQVRNAFQAPQGPSSQTELGGAPGASGSSSGGSGGEAAQQQP